MYRSLVLMLIFYSTVDLYAQSKTIIFYRETGSLDFDFLGAERANKANREGEDTAYIPTDDEIKKREAVIDVFKDLASNFADTVKAWKEGNFVITTSSRSGPAKRMLYELPSKRFLVVDPDNPQLLLPGDTIYSEVFNCKGNPGCSITYTLQKERGEKIILGYACVNYTIGTTHEDGTGRERYSIWVTNKVKPVLPAHAMIRLPTTILEAYTALEITEYFNDGSSSHTVRKAISIVH